MIRRNFIQLIPGAAVSGFAIKSPGRFLENELPPATRTYWVEVIEKIVKPVLESLAAGNLKKNMPVECLKGHLEDRQKYSHLEAFGRSLAGIAPWLELEDDNTEEGKKRNYYFQLAQKCLNNATNPDSPDYLNFSDGGQALVDTAFLAHGLIRAPRLWNSLDKKIQERMINCFLLTRKIKPVYSNWLLFSAIIEGFFLKYGYDWDPMRIDFAVKKHFEWYKGDGIYGDGPDFHWDYYNSFVIQPMLTDTLKILTDKGNETIDKYDNALQRMQRFGIILERLISPEGTFPPIGRSLAYRFGAFQALSQLVLQDKLPVELKAGQVKNALSQVIRKMIEVPGTFDKGGWLTIGFSGHQPSMGEKYISTGSLYLCTTALLPLGLPADAEFWKAIPQDWTSKKIWAGMDTPCDSALYRS